MKLGFSEGGQKWRKRGDSDGGGYGGDIGGWRPPMRTRNVVVDTVIKEGKMGMCFDVMSRASLRFFLLSFFFFFFFFFGTFVGISFLVISLLLISNLESRPH